MTEKCFRIATDLNLIVSGKTNGLKIDLPNGALKWNEQTKLQNRRCLMAKLNIKEIFNYT